MRCSSGRQPAPISRKRCWNLATFSVEVEIPPPLQSIYIMNISTWLLLLLLLLTWHCKAPYKLKSACLIKKTALNKCLAKVSGPTDKSELSPTVAKFIPTGSGPATAKDLEPHSVLCPGIYIDLKLHCFVQFSEFKSKWYINKVAVYSDTQKKEIIWYHESGQNWPITFLHFIPEIIIFILLFVRKVS